LAQQVAKVRMQERAIVEVCPQGDNHMQAAGRISDGREKAIEKLRGLGVVVDAGENMFKLVNDEKQLTIIRWQKQLRGSQQTTFIAP